MRFTSFCVVAPLAIAHALAPAFAHAETSAAPAAVSTTATTSAHPGTTPLEGQPPAVAEVDTDRSFYLSISPLHLIGPIVELTGEGRLHRNVGLSLIGGYGSIKVDGIEERFKVWEVGGQVVGYPVGHFDHGMQLGVEILYAGVSTGNKTSSNVAVGTAEGLAAGPLIGYKLATRVGFTFNIQGGVEYIVARADASAGGASASASQSRLIPLLNLNVGWSF